MNDSVKGKADPHLHLKVEQPMAIEKQSSKVHGMNSNACATAAEPIYGAVCQGVSSATRCPRTDRTAGGRARRPIAVQPLAAEGRSAQLALSGLLHVATRLLGLHVTRAAVVAGHRTRLHPPAARH